jgi:YbbR domain-containing protein
MATLKLIFSVGVIVAVVFLGFKVVPVFFSNYQFQDFIKQEALQSTYSTRSEDDIRAAVIKHANDYDITLTPAQVHVSRTGINGNGNLTIEADYSVPIDLPGYSTTVDFHPSSKNKGVF